MIDLSYTRHVVEVFVRPVDGTLKLKSKRYLMLEAGKGNATIRRDRYATEVEGKKLMQEEFFKAMLTCVKFICEKVDLFYDTYETLWIDGYQKRLDYREKARGFLKDLKKPNLAESASKADKWDESMITEDLYKDCFTKLGLLKSNSDKPWEFTDDPKFKFNYVKDSAKAYWESAFNIYKHIRTLPHILDNYQELDLDLFGWMPTCLERALKEVDDKTKWSKNWKKEFAEGA